MTIMAWPRKIMEHKELEKNKLKHNKKHHDYNPIIAYTNNTDYRI